MSHIALYRKYRPQTFDEIIGQEHVVGTLKDAVAAGKVTHSYLFHGSRGTGKTSVARILAREIGCEPEDLYEIDAASNRGIDDVRELRDAVRTFPFKSPRKVYIIDEVHMLTKEAFNALLKTLEEPPEHAVFVLATTELVRVPETILSRCELHTFKKPTHADIRASLEAVSKKEGFSLDAGALDLLVLLGDGSFRDAQGALQKVLSAAHGRKVSLEDAERITNAPPQALVRALITALADGSLEEALRAVNDAARHNIDMKLFLKLVLRTARLIVLFRHAPNIREKVEHEFSEDELSFVERYARDEGTGISSKTILALLEAYTKIDHAHLPQLPLELAVVRLLGENV